MHGMIRKCFWQHLKPGREPAGRFEITVICQPFATVLSLKTHDTPQIHGIEGRLKDLKRNRSFGGDPSEICDFWKGIDSFSLQPRNL